MVHGKFYVIFFLKHRNKVRVLLHLFFRQWSFESALSSGGTTADTFVSVARQPQGEQTDAL